MGALVHGGAAVPDGFFLPPNMIAVGDPIRVLPPNDPEALGEAVRSTGFARLAFGVQAAWEDRVARYEQVGRGALGGIRGGRGRRGRVVWR